MEGNSGEWEEVWSEESDRRVEDVRVWSRGEKKSRRVKRMAG